MPEAQIQRRHLTFPATPPHAQVCGLLFQALDDGFVDNVKWVPSHSSDLLVGQVLRGDGLPITLGDVCANQQADRLAKLAVEAHMG